MVLARGIRAPPGTCSSWKKMMYLTCGQLIASLTAVDWGKFKAHLKKLQFTCGCSDVFSSPEPKAHKVSL